jgi:hypothetical protein
MKKKKKTLLAELTAQVRSTSAAFVMLAATSENPHVQVVADKMIEAAKYLEEQDQKAPLFIAQEEDDGDDDADDQKPSMGFGIKHAA